MKYVMVATILLLFGALVWGAVTPANAQTYSLETTVVRVVDGDGVYVEGEKRQIRLFGVDAPERNEADFNAATDALRALVEGQRVRVIYLYTDRFDRVVGRIFANGEEVNARLIHDGPAVEFCKYSEGFYGTCLTS